MRAVQADRCLNSEQIDTLFISVGGQEGGFGGGGHFGPEAQNLHVTVRKIVLTPPGNFTSILHATNRFVINLPPS